MVRFTTAALLLALAAVPVTTVLGQAAVGKAALVKAVEPAVVKGKVEAVTVYRGQALVTRVVDLPGAGVSEVIVSELPEKLVASSLFAEAAEGIEVRSVRYRERPQPVDVRDEVRVLDEQIRALGDAMAGNQKQQALLGEQRAYLDKLSNFTAPTATVEMTKGVLNSEQLKGLTEYQFSARKSISDQEMKLQVESRKLQEDLNLKQRERNEIAQHSERTLREAVVVISQEKAGGKMRLRYLVDNAMWFPSYNIRADAERKAATLEYQASISQMSGEDWTDVAMTLSTATPSLVANAPMLSPLTIQLAARGSDPVTMNLGTALDYKQAKDSIVLQRQNAEVFRNSNSNAGANGQWNSGNHNRDGQVVGFGNLSNFTANGAVQMSQNGEDNDKQLNKIADQLQVLELVVKDTREKDEPRPRVKSTEGLVVTYALKNHTSLPSRADQQLIQIDAFGLKGDFYKVAIPVLTNYVYDEAMMTNSSSSVILAGPVSSYVGGQFVGSGEVPTVAAGQTFTVGFGIDSALRATRERTDRTETIQGGNRLVSYSYRIAIENFGAKAAAVRIMDRMPTAKDNEVKINFVSAADTPLSEDKEYQKLDRKKGLLRWDVTVPAQKNGVEAFDMTYKLEMEYDKNMGISASQVLKQQDLEKMMMEQRR